MNTALSSWLGETINNLYGEDVACCSLKVTLPDEWEIIQDECEYEAYSLQTIPPKYIKFHKTE